MEAAPSAAFEVSKPDLLLEFLIIALDAPAQHGVIDQVFKADVFGKIGKPIFERLVLVVWPFDQQPLFGAQVGALVILGRSS